MRSPRNTEEEEVFIEKAAAGPKDHVMLERKSAAEMIKVGSFRGLLRGELRVYRLAGTHRVHTRA